MGRLNTEVRDETLWIMRICKSVYGAKSWYEFFDMHFPEVIQDLNELKMMYRERFKKTFEEQQKKRGG